MSVTTFTLGAVVALFIFRYCIPYNVVMFFVDLVPKHVQSWTLTMIMPKFSFPQYEHSKPPLILQTASNLVRRWLAHPDVQSHFVHCFRREYSEAPPNAEERRIILTILLKELPRILVLQPNAMNAYAFHIRRPLSDANAIAINKEFLRSIERQLATDPDFYPIFELFLAAIMMHEFTHFVITHHSPVVDDGIAITPEFMKFGSRAKHSGEFIEMKLFGFMLRHYSITPDKPFHLDCLLASDAQNRVWSVSFQAILRQLEQPYPTPWTLEEMDSTNLELNKTFGLGELNGTDSPPASPLHSRRANAVDGGMVYNPGYDVIIKPEQKK